MRKYQSILVFLGVALATFSISLTLADQATAQDRGERDRGGDRGDRDRGDRGDRDRGGRGDRDRGDRDRGDRDRGDRDRGDRGGGDRGGGGEDRRAQWMRSLDQNGDGRLELNEIPEQMRGRFEERAKQSGFDINKPIPIDRYLQQRNEQDRRERQGLDPNNPTAFQGDLQPQQAPQFGEPLTPEELLMLNPDMRREILLESADPSVIGKGVTITPPGSEIKLDKEQAERVEQDAKRILERFDQNKNGVIDGDELNSNPWMRGQDTNGDGKVTVEESKAAMARFRSGGGGGGWGGRGGDRGGDGGRGRGGGDRGDGDRGSRGWGGRGGRGDFGGGGRGDFGGGRPGFGGPGGQGGEGFGGRGGDRSFGGRGGEDGQEGNAEGEGKQEEEARRSYRFTPAQERLSDSARDWIVPKDKNGNGQVEMSEFATTWNSSKLREFDEWDSDRDGVVTAAEVEAKGPAPRASFRDRRRGGGPSGEGGDDEGRGGQEENRRGDDEGDAGDDR